MWAKLSHRAAEKNIEILYMLVKFIPEFIADNGRITDLKVLVI